MQAVGMVVEYNPFHNGHRYHATQAKRLTGAQVSVAVMSGNFTQRGEPTIVDKWQRANEALHNGVDLVVELPLADAVQPAHLFADGAMRLLRQLGVQDFVFGAEHPDWPYPQLVAAERQFDGDSFDQYNATYATLFNQQLQQHTGQQLTAPNDILAFAYYKAQAQQPDDRLHLHPIKRVGSDYHDAVIDQTQEIASATAVRQAVLDHTLAYQAVVPDETAYDLAAVTSVPTWQRLYPALRYQLIQSSVEHLRQTYQMAEGLEYRMKEMAETATNFDQFIHMVKTKRYTYSRLIRVCLYTLLQVSAEEMQWHRQRPYLRILGFNQSGQAYLHEIKKRATIPIISRVDHDLKESMLQLDFRAGKMYELLTQGAQQDMTRRPIILK